MQATFVRAKLGGASIQEAAAVAGYADPETTGYHVLRQVGVQRAIEEATRSRLRHDMGPRALQVLDQIASDPDANSRVRVAAAKSLTDLSGMTISNANEGGTRKDLADMSAEDIALAMSKLENLLASKARDITPETRHETPNGPPDSAQVIDLLD